MTAMIHVTGQALSVRQHTHAFASHIKNVGCERGVSPSLPTLVATKAILNTGT